MPDTLTPERLTALNEAYIPLPIEPTGEEEIIAELLSHIDALTVAVDGLDGSRFAGVSGSWVRREDVLAILRGEQ